VFLCELCDLSSLRFSELLTAERAGIAQGKTKRVKNKKRGFEAALLVSVYIYCDRFDRAIETWFGSLYLEANQVLRQKQACQGS
jgi:hypothetical protein